MQRQFGEEADRQEWPSAKERRARELGDDRSASSFTQDRPSGGAALECSRSAAASLTLGYARSFEEVVQVLSAASSGESAIAGEKRLLAEEETGIFVCRKTGGRVVNQSLIGRPECLFRHLLLPQGPDDVVAKLRRQPRPTRRLVTPRAVNRRALVKLKQQARVSGATHTAAYRLTTLGVGVTGFVQENYLVQHHTKSEYSPSVGTIELLHQLLEASADPSRLAEIIASPRTLEIAVGGGGGLEIAPG